MSTRQDIIEAYKTTHAGSQKLHEEARKLFGADGTSHTGHMFYPFGPYITHAKGSRMWDVDGNEYIDYLLAHGSQILGHCHPAIVQAVKEQMDRGIHYGTNHELEIELAKLIKEMMPMAERVEFCSSGNEANQLAIRLARAFTGRKKILTFEHSHLGWASQYSPPGEPGVPPEENVINTTFIPANDLNRVEEELAKKEYAILITEAGGASNGKIPLDRDFVQALRGLTLKYATIWLVDEILTCFRDSPGGWQATVGITPDLTTLGKCVGGGTGVGIIIGRADISDLFGSKTPKERRVCHRGSWCGNAVTCSAGIAVAKILKTGEVQRKINELGDYLRKKGNELLKAQGISARFYGPTKSLVNLYFGPIDYEPSDDQMLPTKDIYKILNPADPPLQARLNLHLLQRGIATGRGEKFSLSMAHTKEDIDQTVKSLGDSIDDMIAEGTFDKYAKENKYGSIINR